MKFSKTAIEGLQIIEQERQTDNRGYFARTFCEQELKQAGINFSICQSSISFNIQKGTLRGMHFQLAPKPEAKIIRCTRGAVFDVAVDLRKNSSSYLKWVSTELSEENGRAFYIPVGCAHGFITLLPNTELLYMMDVEYYATSAGGVRWNDKAFGIKWPSEPTLMSDKDAVWPDYAQ